MHYVKYNITIPYNCRDGRPSVRMVLLKDFDHQGFTFFTNENGRKAADMVIKLDNVILYQVNLDKFYFCKSRASYNI